MYKFGVFNVFKYLKLIMQPLWQICILIMPCFPPHLAFSCPLLIELSWLGWVNFFSLDSFPSSEGFLSVFSSGYCLIHVCMLGHVQSLQEGPCHEQPLWSIPLLLSTALLDMQLNINFHTSTWQLFLFFFFFVGPVGEHSKISFLLIAPNLYHSLQLGLRKGIQGSNLQAFKITHS